MCRNRVCMQLAAHAPVARIGVRYEQGSERREAPSAKDWESVGKGKGAPRTNENGFYEALATQYAYLFFENLGLATEGGTERKAAATLLASVNQALAEHNIPNPAKVGSLEKKVDRLMVGAIAKSLRQCVAAHLTKHFDALFTSPFGGEDNRDSLYHLYNALHPTWRQDLRHTNDAEPENVPTHPYNAGKERLKSAALMYILQRVSPNKTRVEASRLEANIAAHMFRAFIYLYKGEAEENAQLDRIYGPDVETFQKSEKLLRVAILADGKGHYSFFHDPVPHMVKNDGIRAVADGDNTGAVQQAIEKRVSIIGGLTPLREAQRAVDDRKPTENNVAIIDLMRRGAVHLRPLDPTSNDWVNGKTRAATEEEEAILKERRAEWREAASNEQAERAQRNRGRATQGGYPEPRTLEDADAKPDESKRWTWEDLQSEEREGDRQRALDKIAAYGIDDDRKQRKRADKMSDRRKRDAQLQLLDKKKPWGVTSWWEHRNECSNRGPLKCAPTKKYTQVANRMAAEVWHETHRMRQPPKYKSCIRDRNDDEVERLANRRMVVNNWMKGHMRRPKLPNGKTPTTAAERRETDALRCQAALHFMNTYPLHEHPNLKHKLSLIDGSKRNLLDGEYADFMAAERRLLMNVLKRVPRDGNNTDALEESYEADAASFVICKEDEDKDEDVDMDAPKPASTAPKPTPTAPKPAPTAPKPAPTAPSGGGGAGGGASANPKTWTPSDLNRALISDGLEYGFGLSGQDKAPWTKGEGNYAPEVAAKLIANAKGFRERKKNAKKTPLPPDEEDDTMSVGRIRGRIAIYRQCVVAQNEDMPNKTETNRYNAALVRLLEFFDEIQPQETNYLATGDEGDQWPHRNQFLKDDLVGRPDPKVRLENYERSSEKVNSATTILTRLIQRYHEYATAHDGDFRLQDPVWKRFGDQFEKSKEEKFRATTIEKAFYSDLLICFPVAKRKSAGGGLNSIMQFVSWFHQHVWEEWTDGKRRFQSKLCRFAGVPNVDSWNTSKMSEKKTGEKDSVLWLKTNWEFTLRRDIKNRLDTLWKAVSFTKRALDFAVVDEDSPLKATPELQAVLKKWMDMTTGKFGMILPGAATDMDVEEETAHVNVATDTDTEDEGDAFDGAANGDTEEEAAAEEEEEEEDEPFKASRKPSQNQLDVRRAMASSDEDDD